MSDDFSKATASPSVISLAGKEYKLGKFGPRDLGDLQAYIKDAVPDPRLMARELCAGLPDAVALAIWTDLSREAQDWPPAIESARGDRILMMTYGGAVRVLWVALRRHNRFDEKDAEELAKLVTQDELNEVVRRSFPEATFDPKSTAATEPQ
jgi:hypothetical protein